MVAQAGSVDDETSGLNQRFYRVVTEVVVIEDD